MSDAERIATLKAALSEIADLYEPDLCIPECSLEDPRCTPMIAKAAIAKADAQSS